MDTAQLLDAGLDLLGSRPASTGHEERQVGAGHKDERVCAQHYGRDVENDQIKIVLQFAEDLAQSIRSQQALGRHAFCVPADDDHAV